MPSALPFHWIILSAAGLTSGWMLLWGLTAAIPLVLHLIYRRQQKHVAWAAMALLQQVLKQQARRIRLEQLLLLVIRMSIPVCLAIALAAPYFDQPSILQDPPPTSPSKAWIFAVDTSYSMGYIQDNQTRLSEAKRILHEILRKANQGDSFQLVQISQPSRAIISQPTFDTREAASAIDSLELLDTGADLDQGLDLIESMIQLGKNGDLPIDVQLVIVTDLGIDTWGNRQDQIARLQRLSKTCSLSVQSVAADQPSNLAIMDMRPTSYQVVRDQEFSVSVTIHNFSDSDVVDLPLSILENQQVKSSQKITLPARSEQTYRLPLSTHTLGEVALTARLGEDPLPADNERSAVVLCKERIHVLLVENHRLATKWIQLALLPSPDLSSLSVQAISKFELGARKFEDHAVLLFNDVSSLSDSVRQKIRDFVSQGGAAVFFLGPGTTTDLWKDDADLLGFRLLSMSDDGTFGIDPLDYASPAVEAFAGFPASGLVTTPIFRYWRIQAEPNLQYELAVSDSAPLLVSYRMGNGRVFSLLSSPSAATEQTNQDSWNAMPTWPSFVPLMQGIVHAAASVESPGANSIVGQSVGGRMLFDQAIPAITITLPSGVQRQQKLDVQDSNGLFPWSFSQTYWQGIYKIDTSNGNDPPDKSKLIAVNLDTIQSSLETVPLNSLPHSILSTISTDQPLVASNPTGAMNSLTLGILCCLVLLLISESLFAWQLGKRTL